MPNIVEYEAPDQTAMMVTADGFLQRVEQFPIEDDEQYAGAGTLLKSIKTSGAALDTKRKSITGPLDRVKKDIMDLFRPVVDAHAQAEKLLKNKMLGYQEEVERKQREEQAAANERARKEREKLEARADKHEQAGREEKAAALREEADLNSAPPVPTAIATPRAAGVSTRGVWKAELLDKMDLVKAVAEGRVPLKALDVNMTFLNQQAKSLHDEFNIPGARAYEEKSIAA